MDKSEAKVEELRILCEMWVRKLEKAGNTVVSL